MEEQLEKFAVELFKINAIKFGEYKTKVGLMTPVYCDLRVIVSYPKLLKTLCDLIIHKTKDIPNINIICGVPYTALPIATIISVESNIPMVMRRKEAKDYGTKKLIEGVFKEGDNCLIVEDVVTSGSSILETVKDLKGCGIVCKDAVVLLNRQQGGEHFLLENGIKMHSLLDLTTLMGYLQKAACIDNITRIKVENYIKSTQVQAAVLSNPTQNRLKMSYAERANLAANPIAKELFQIMDAKKTTLCIAADLTDATDILNLAEELGPHICLFKMHVDIITNFHINFIKHLQDIAKTHNFILFEDRKFADIGKTVQLQYSEGLYQISTWAQLVTTHSVTGKGVLDAIKESSGLEKRGVFVLAETSAAGSLIDANYTKATVQLAKDYLDLVAGVVCQSPLFAYQPALVQLTPGVQLDSIGDNLSQQYTTPKKAVLERGADVVVVGRGVTKAADRVKAALEYKEQLWAAYQTRIQQ